MNPMDPGNHSVGIKFGLEIQGGTSTRRPTATFSTELTGSVPIRPGELGGEASLRYQRNLATGNGTVKTSLTARTGDVPKGRPAPNDQIQLSLNGEMSNGIIQAGGVTTHYTRRIDPVSAVTVAADAKMDPKTRDWTQSMDLRYLGQVAPGHKTDVKFHLDQKGSDPYQMSFTGTMDRLMPGFASSHLGVEAKWKDWFEETSFNSNFRLTEANPGLIPGTQLAAKPWELTTSFGFIPVRPDQKDQKDDGFHFKSVFQNPSLFNTADTQAGIEWYRSVNGERSLLKADWMTKDLYAKPEHNLGNIGFHYLQKDEEPFKFNMDGDMRNLNSLPRRFSVFDPVYRPVDRLEHRLDSFSRWLGPTN